MSIDFPSAYFSEARLETSTNFFQISAGAFADNTALFIASRRGRLTINSCKVLTRFPFGFFVKTKVVPVQIETLV